MPVIYMAKKFQALHPTDDAARDVIRKLGQGEIVWYTIAKPSGVGQRFSSRHYWASDYARGFCYAI